MLAGKKNKKVKKYSFLLIVRNIVFPGRFFSQFFIKGFLLRDPRINFFYNFAVGFLLRDHTRRVHLLIESVPCPLYPPLNSSINKTGEIEGPSRQKQTMFEFGGSGAFIKLFFIKGDK